MMSGKRLLIVEEALKNRSGHWYEYNRAIVEEARKQGIEVTVLAHQEIEGDIQEELGAIPFFPVTNWDQVYYHPSAWRRYIGIIRHNFLIARLLGRFFSKQKDPYDIVLVPTVVLYHWLAWRWLIFKGGGKWFQRVVLITRNNAGEYDPEKEEYCYGLSAKVLRWILCSFRRIAKTDLLVLGSDSARIAKQYQEMSGIDFKTFCHPRKTVPADSVSISDKKGGLVFSALGPPRYEKGSDLVLAAIELIFSKQPDFPGHFVIQWNDRVFEPGGNEIMISPDLENHPNVEILRSSLSSEEYENRLAEADCLLLPYRRAQYFSRLSGIAIEAFQTGTPCICISNTWIEDCMNEIGGGVAIENESVADLAATICKMMNAGVVRLEKSKVTEARSFHSPEAFMQQVVSREKK